MWKGESGRQKIHFLVPFEQSDCHDAKVTSLLDELKSKEHYFDVCFWASFAFSDVDLTIFQILCTCSCYKTKNL